MARLSAYIRNLGGEFNSLICETPSRGGFEHQYTSGLVAPLVHFTMLSPSCSCWGAAIARAATATSPNPANATGIMTIAGEILTSGILLYLLALVLPELSGRVLTQITVGAPRWTSEKQA